MRFLRLGIVALVLAAASACGNGGEEDDTAGESDEEVTSTTTVAPTTSRPTTTTTEPVLIPNEVTVTDTTTTQPTDVDEPELSDVEAPPPPTNVNCLASSAAGELRVEWDAPSDPSIVTNVRLYVSVDGGPFITNQNLGVGQVDTTGSRWMSAVRGLDEGDAIRIAVTSFNALGQESGWYPVSATYNGPDQPCGSGDSSTTTLPPATCTAGCDEET